MKRRGRKEEEKRTKGRREEDVREKRKGDNIGIKQTRNTEIFSAAQVTCQDTPVCSHFMRFVHTVVTTSQQW